MKTARDWEQRMAVPQCHVPYRVHHCLQGKLFLLAMFSSCPLWVYNVVCLNWKGKVYLQFSLVPWCPSLTIWGCFLNSSKFPSGFWWALWLSVGVGTVMPMHCGTAIIVSFRVLLWTFRTVALITFLMYHPLWIWWSQANSADKITVQHDLW